MRRIIHSLLLCFASVPLAAQNYNLIANWSFENFIDLPRNESEIHYLRGNWFNPVGDYTGFPYASADYKHKLGIGRAKLPDTFHGYLQAQNGSACIGLIPYGTWVPDYREYAAVRLMQPLKVGATYHLRFYLTNGEKHYYCQGAIDKMAVAFTVERPKQRYHEPLPIQPQIHFDEFLWEPEWRKMEQNFVADKPYEYMILGNFFPDSLTKYTRMTADTSNANAEDGAYYFVDNFSLKKIADPMPPPAGDSVQSPLDPKRLAELQKTKKLPKRVMGRKVDPQTITVSSSTLTLQVYDAGADDGDTISLNWNGKWLVQRQAAQKRGVKFDINIDPEGNNTLIFFAHSLGRVPPNTVVLAFMDGTRREVITVKSDYARCAAIRFKVRK